MARRSLTPPRESLRAVQAFGSGLSARAKSPARSGSLRLSGAAASFEDEQAPLALGGGGGGGGAAAAPPPLGAAGGQPPPDMETHAEALFAAVDRDGSGLISYEEFQTWWAQRTSATADESLLGDAKAKWDELDRDGSGDLDAKEFENLITALATSDWKEAYDQQRGKSYYYNKVTKETRWQQTDGDDAVSAFLSQNGVRVRPKAKADGFAAIGRAKQQASRLANSDTARRARERASEKSARAREVARQKTDQVQASEKYQKATAAASEWNASAEMWKTQAKDQHRKELALAAACLFAATILGFYFMYEWYNYVPPLPPPPPVVVDTSTGGIGETGQILALTHEWQWVRLKERYEHPVVFPGVPSTHEQHIDMTGETEHARDPAVGRIQSVQKGCPGWRGWCFEIKMQEPDCSEDGGVHLPGETLSWMVIDRGIYRMQGQGVTDKLMQASIVSTRGSAFITVVPTPFPDGVQPVVLTQVQTNRDPAFVKTRQKQSIGYSGGVFEVKLEQAYGDNVHGLEEIGWFAMEPSSGTLGTLTFEAAITEPVNSRSHVLNFQSNFSTVPLVFANIGTFHGGESAMVRSESRAAHSISVLIHEDACVAHHTGHTNENLALLVVQSDTNGILRAERIMEPTTYCPASGTHFTFIDTGQFVSWSLAKIAADNHVIATAHRPGMKSHLATIKTAAEQECVKRVASIARDELHEVAVGWIGATDATWLSWWYDVMSVHHADPMASARSDGVPWTRYARDGTHLLCDFEAIDTDGWSTDLRCTEGHEPGELIDGWYQLPMEEIEQADCGGLGTIVGGFGKLGRDHYLQKTYGIGADGGLEKPLPSHAAVNIELDFVKVDSWDGETAYLWVEGAPENPVWEHTFGNNAGRNYCGRPGHGWNEQKAHISKTVLRAGCEDVPIPEWCKTLTLKFNSTLNQHTDDESFGIQNIIISYRGDTSQWRWENDGTPLSGPASGWSPAVSRAPPLGEANPAILRNSPWHPGQPSGDEEHYAAVEWPNWETGAWHDCESESQRVPAVWPRCFYGLYSNPRQDTGGPSACDDCITIAYPTTQWPGDSEWGMTMVLDVIDNVAPATIPHPTDYLSIMHVGNQRGERSPAVWIKPDATERRLQIRTSTRVDSEFGCVTEDLNGLLSGDERQAPLEQWTKPLLGRNPGTQTEKQHIHLAVTVEYTGGVSKLYVYINGEIASNDCNGKEASGQIRDYDAPLFLGGDPFYGGFKGEIESLCLHPGYLNAESVASLFINEVKAARAGVHIGAANSLTAQTEAQTDGRVVTNLAIPFRWDNLDAAFGHATDSFDVPGRALQFPGLAGHADTVTYAFGVEMSIKVMQRPNGQFRNVFHLGNDDEGFAHVCILEPGSMNLIIGVAQGSTILGDGETDPRTLRASCRSQSEIFLDEEVILVYSFELSAASMTGKLFVNGDISTGCEFTRNTATDTAAATDTATLRTKMTEVRPVIPDDVSSGRALCEHLHLILGDAPMSRHGIDIDLPGFYGDIARFVIHEQSLDPADVANLYEPHCGKHLHGYYVESTLPPLHETTGGEGLVYDPDVCDGYCETFMALTMLMLMVACCCCAVLGFVMWPKKAPLLDVSPEMMPTIGMGDPDPGRGSGAGMDLEMTMAEPARLEAALPAPRYQSNPSLEDLRDEPEPEPEPVEAATSPPRTRPPSLAQVGANVRNAQRATRSTTPDRSAGLSAPKRTPPARTATPPRRAAPSLDSLGGAGVSANRLSPGRRRDVRMPDLEETEHSTSVSGFRAAFEQGQAPGASMEELRQSGRKVTTRAASPRRTTAS
jgi:hypothetical protein